MRNARVSGKVRCLCLLVQPIEDYFYVARVRVLLQQSGDRASEHSLHVSAEKLRKENSHKRVTQRTWFRTQIIFKLSVFLENELLFTQTDWAGNPRREGMFDVESLRPLIVSAHAHRPELISDLTPICPADTVLSVWHVHTHCERRWSVPSTLNTNQTSFAGCLF
jgi:hypothetical protein